MIFSYLIGGNGGYSSGQTIFMFAVGFLCMLASVLIHEACHFAVLRRFSYGVSEEKKRFPPVYLIYAAVMTVFTFCPLKAHRTNMSRGKNVASALSGVAANFVAMLLGAALGRAFSALCLSYDAAVFGYISLVFELFAEANAATLMFNILPIPNLDGGEAFAALIPGKPREKWQSIGPEYTVFICAALILILCRTGFAVQYRDLLLGVSERLFGMVFGA